MILIMAFVVRLDEPSLNVIDTEREGLKPRNIGTKWGDMTQHRSIF